jgi:serine/threonine protein kinase
LRFDPDERITVEEALSHPYFAPLHSLDDEPECSEINLDDWKFDIQTGFSSKDEIKYLMCKEIVRFNPHLKLSPLPSTYPGHNRSNSF